MGALRKHQNVSGVSNSIDLRSGRGLYNLGGFIFVCNNQTIPERPIFGLPAGYADKVRAVRKGMPLFLFNFTSRLLYGVFEATSDGGFNIDPYAWENTDLSLKGGRPVSRYPAQVRVRIREDRPALDEETFSFVLEYVDKHRFKHDLTVKQVQQLLRLFGSSQTPLRELPLGGNGRNVHMPAINSRDSESPRSTYKSDSDYYSDSSGRGVNSSWEDDWAEESEVHYPRQHGGEGVVAKRLGHVTLDETQVYGNGNFEMEDQLSSSYHEDLAWKERHGGACHDQDGSMVLRLHDDDPAVNSNSNSCSQANFNDSLLMDSQNNIASMPMVPSQMQFPITCRDNMRLIPVQGAPCPHGETSDYTQTIKCNDQRKASRGGGLSMAQKQSVKYNRSNRSKHARFNGHQPLAGQLQNPEFNEVLLPLHTQGEEQVGDQGTTLPHLVTPTSGPISFAQLQTGARLDESGPAFQLSANDMQISPESMQHLLQTQRLQGQLVQTGQGLVLLMPSIIPRPPSAQPGTIATVLANALHFEVLEFARWTRPSSEVQLHVEAAIDAVRKGVNMVWPEADVEVFGSFATGLCLQHSDVDLAVIDAPRLPGSENLSLAQASAPLIRMLATGLRTFEWCESINTLDTASMPVVKCLCRPFGTSSSSSVPAIAVDLTIGGIRSDRPSSPMESLVKAVHPGKFSTRHTGGVAREYVLQKIRELPALAPLVLLLKSFLHHKGLSNVYSGGLGSFSLTLLVAFFLERISSIEACVDMTAIDLPTSPSSSPLSCSSVFSDDSDAWSSKSSFGASTNSGSDCSSHQSLGECYVRRAAGTIERVLSFVDRAGSGQLGILLLGFLQTFGCEHDLSRVKIVLKGPDEPGRFKNRDDRHVALWIDDPLRPGVNIGAGSFGMLHVQNAFKEMLYVLLGNLPGLSPTPLHCSEEACQDLGTMGQFGCLSRLVMRQQAEDLR